MALIRCERCGKQITDTIKKCPHCGYRNIFYRNIKLEKIKEKRVIILITSFVVLFIIIGVILCTKSYIDTQNFIAEEANKLTKEEQIGTDALRTIKNNNINYDGLNINEIWYRKTNLAQNQLLIEYISIDKTVSAVIQLIENEKIIGDDRKADKIIGKYTSETEKLEITKAKEIRELWATKGRIC